MNSIIMLTKTEAYVADQKWLKPIMLYMRVQAYIPIKFV